MFAIGDQEWPGISKLVEECGEALQICGKLMGTGGELEHWDGEGNLKKRLEDELADLQAAIAFMCRVNDFDHERMAERFAKKMVRFERWHELGLTNLLALREVACVVCERPIKERIDGELICVFCHEAKR